MILKKRLILASQSPRRSSLLRQIGLQVEIVPCGLPEEFNASASAEENARTLALAKARCVADGIADAFVLAADTIVTLNGIMLGKPTDPDDAVRMLEMLSGKTHTVHTGFALLDRPSGRIVEGVEATRVTFRNLPREEILEYVAGGSPMDKAGAYGIQDDYGAVFVMRIEGCYYNVVGLPLARVYGALQELQEQLGLQ
jgi:septum formation protein